MSILAERIRAEETKAAHADSLRFKARVRRDRLFGLWLAEEYLHLNEDLADAYADAYVDLDFLEHHRDDALLDKAERDLAGCGRSVSRHILERHLHQLARTAMHELVTT